MTGLLDGLSDPDFLAAIAEQRALAERCAAAWGMTVEQAAADLVAQDIEAVEMFKVGNTIPRKWLH
jgi:hypothetical protein